LSRGERLFHLRDRVKQVYFVTDGELKAVRYQPDGKESIMLCSGAGEFFGEPALIEERYVCDAFSTRDSRVAVLPALRQCSRYERLRLSRARDRDRVLHLLSSEAGADGVYPLNGPLVDLADELGLEPETLYRVLKELTRDGVIARTSSTLQLLASR